MACRKPSVRVLGHDRGRPYSRQTSRYHMPFPAVGYVDTGRDGAAFRWVPEAGQLMG